MGIRGLQSFLEKRGVWERVNLVAEAAKCPEGITILVDLVAFFHFCFESIVHRPSDQIRCLSEGIMHEAHESCFNLIKAFQSANIHLEFISDAARGSNDCEWKSKFDTWKKRYEIKLSNFQYVESFLDGIRGCTTKPLATESEPTPIQLDDSGNPYSPDPTRLQGSLTPPLNNILLWTIGVFLDYPICFPECEGDRVIQAMVQLRNSKKRFANFDDSSTRLVVEAITNLRKIYGVLGNDTDFAVMRDSKLIAHNEFASENGFPIGKRDFKSIAEGKAKLSSVWCKTANAEQICRSLRQIQPHDLPEVAIMAGCDFTSSYDRELSGFHGAPKYRSFFPASRFVADLKTDATGRCRVEKHKEIARLKSHNPNFASAVKHTRNFYAYDLCPDSAAGASKLLAGLGDAKDAGHLEEIFRYAKEVARCRASLPSEAWNEPNDLKDYLRFMRGLGLMPSSFWSEITHGRYWESGVVESQHSFSIQNLLKPLFFCRFLLLSPATDRMEMVTRDRGLTLRIALVKIPASDVQKKCVGLSPSDHAAGYTKRFWPSVTTLHRAPAAVRLNMFTWFCSLIGVTTTTVAPENMMSDVASALRDQFDRELAAQSGCETPGLIVLLIKVVSSLNTPIKHHPNASKAGQWRLRRHELESLALTVLLTFWKAIGSFPPSIIDDSLSETLDDDNCIPARTMIQQDVKLCNSLFVKDEIHKNVLNAEDCDPLGILSDKALGHSDIIVDFKCIELINRLQLCAGFLLDMLHLFGLLRPTLVPDKLSILKGEKYRSATCCYSPINFFDSRMYSWLQCAGAIDAKECVPKNVKVAARYQSHKRPGWVLPYEGGPVWASVAGMEVLDKVRKQRLAFLGMPQIKNLFDSLFG